MNESKTEFGRRLFGDLDAPESPTTQLADPLHEQELRALIADSRQQQFVSVVGGHSPLTSPVHRCVTTGQRQTCELIWKSEGIETRGQIEIEPTDDGGLRILPTAETDHWTQIGVIFFRPSALTFEPFSSRIRINQDQPRPGSDPKPVQSYPVAMVLGAASGDSGDDELCFGRVTWNPEKSKNDAGKTIQKDQINVFIPSDGTIGTSFVLVEAAWTALNGADVRKVKLIRVTWDDVEQGLVGHRRINRPERTREGYATLRVSPVTPDRLWELVHQSGISRSDVDRFRAASDEVIVRRFHKCDDGWQTNGIRLSSEQTAAILFGTPRSREASTPQAACEHDDDPDEFPKNPLSDVDAQLLAIYVSSDPDKRQRLFNDVAETLRPKLDCYSRGDGSIVDGDDLTQDSLIKLWCQLEEGKFLQESYVLATARNGHNQCFRNLKKRDKTSQGFVERGSSYAEDVDESPRPCEPWSPASTVDQFSSDEQRVYQLIRDHDTGDLDTIIGEEFGLKQGAARRRREAVIRKLRVAYAIHLAAGEADAGLCREIADAEG